MKSNDWWEGRVSSGDKGAFPSAYVRLDDASLNLDLSHLEKIFRAISLKYNFANKEVLSGKELRPMFVSTNLSSETLGMLWQIVDIEDTGKLAKFQI